MTVRLRIDYSTLSDVELAACCVARDREAVRLVTIANNQRLFRAAWSILKHRQDAEEAVQAAYLKGFAAMDGFDGRASLSTWLTRIVINEALGRLRATRRRRAHLESENVMVLDRYRDTLARGSSHPAPDAALAREQLRTLLERAIADLPDAFRTVFVLRQVEGLSVDETAEVLGLVPATVKTRLLRARRRLQEALEPDVHDALVGAFPFAGADCERMTARVLAALQYE
ncbi:MAG TPA: RNA polymerase sigma factor [Sphingomicrobium sp.]|nr:RNA polymerase sigma factor [Sphingomicrobium sp.]